MSQVATAYVITPDQIDDAARLAVAGDEAGFHNELQESELDPGYPYSGYALAVLLAYLDEHGASLPCEPADSRAAAIVAKFEPVVCVGREEGEACLTALQSLSTTESELRSYFENFTEEQWPEAGQAMLAGISFLTSALKLQQMVGGWLIVFIG